MSLSILHRRRLQQVESVFPNTFIGGLAATYPTAADLAAKLLINESDISYYEISGSDIKAQIEVTYALTDFTNNNNITDYKDHDGKITRISNWAFYGCTGLTGRMEFKGVTAFAAGYSGYYTFRNSNVTELSFPNLTDFCTGSGNGGNFAPLTLIKLEIPKATKIGATNGNDSTLTTIPTDLEIVCPASLATANAGAEEGDIAYARNLKGATITYV